MTEEIIVLNDTQVGNDGIRMAKYETLIEDINQALKIDIFSLSISGLFFVRRNTPIDCIFNRNKVNEYARTIINKARLRLTEDSSNKDPWMDRYGSSPLDNDREKISALKDFVMYCKNHNNRAEGYKLIFWCLMILSVDDTDADDKLSLICDIAKMLKITDDELIDIAYVIKCVYNEADEEYTFKTDMVQEVFGKVISLYD